MTVDRAPRDLSFPVMVERRTNLGWMSKLHLRLEDGQVLVAEVPNDETLGLSVGERAFAGLHGAKVFDAGRVEPSAAEPEPEPFGAESDAMAEAV